VQKQVDLLIQQATSNENLCQCYIGWWVSFLFICGRRVFLTPGPCGIGERHWTLCQRSQIQNWVNPMRVYCTSSLSPVEKSN
jgi:hypothetical protein